MLPIYGMNRYGGAVGIIIQCFPHDPLLSVEMGLLYLPRDGAANESESIGERLRKAMPERWEYFAQRASDEFYEFELTRLLDDFVYYRYLG